ncbi:MAG: hypothetical protein LBE70_01885 [Nitrososphaerota archaeon]|nr:hypothetical protein [Nitrososphaerota archaeon]
MCGNFNGHSVEWVRTYGSHSGRNVIQTADGGYAITGSAASWNIHGYNNYTGVLIKTDSSGEVQWVNSYDYLFPIVVQSDDFDCLLTSSDYDSYGFIKVDVNGQEQWRKSSGSYSDSVRRAGVQTSDGGFLLVTFVSVNPWLEDVFLVKVDSGGRELWNKTLSTGSNIYGVSISGMVATDNGGFVLAGTWSDSGFWVDRNFWLAIYDSFGNLIRHNYYNDSSSRNYVTAVGQTVDGGYILAGDDGVDGWLVKTDSLGVEQWRRCTAGLVRLDSIKQTSDGGFIVVGNYSMLLRFDAFGFLKWKILLDMSPSAVIVTDDGGYVVVGVSGRSVYDDQNICLVKFAPESTSISSILIATVVATVIVISIACVIVCKKTGRVPVFRVRQTREN